MSSSVGLDRLRALRQRVSGRYYWPYSLLQFVTQRSVMCWRLVLTGPSRACSGWRTPCSCDRVDGSAHQVRPAGRARLVTPGAPDHRKGDRVPGRVACPEGRSPVNDGIAPDVHGDRLGQRPGSLGVGSVTVKVRSPRSVPLNVPRSVNDQDSLLTQRLNITRSPSIRVLRLTRGLCV